MRCVTTFFWSAALSCLAVSLLITSSSAGPYAVSAHGTRVDRTAGSVPLPTEYSIGNCAHCHEQHSSIGGTEPDPATGTSGFLLLADGFDMGKTTNPYFQNSNACFYCHSSVGSLQNGGIVNENYSATFGGAPATITGIMQAFNQVSYHNLYDISRYITGVIGTKSFTNFPAGTNPCSGCHNVHMAKANKTDPGDPTKTAISKPSAHDQLWGDDTTERMPSTGTEYYQPPNRVGGGLEPDGGADRVTQAAKTPDYDSSCIDCHNLNNTITSTVLGTLKKFDWALEQHGWGNANDDSNRTQMAAPYSDSNLGNYVVSCLDCHEPHGSPNIYLIRSSVNDGSVSLTEVVGTDRNYIPWDNLCSRCHASAGDLQGLHHTYKVNSPKNCLLCHYSEQGPVINSSDPVVKDCTTCHYHGSSALTFKTF